MQKNLVARLAARRQSLAAKLAKSMGAVVVGTFATLEAARAELPAAVATSFASVKSDASALNDLVVPIVIAILGMFIVLKLIKRFAGKI